MSKFGFLREKKTPGLRRNVKFIMKSLKKAFKILEWQISFRYVPVLGRGNKLFHLASSVENLTSEQDRSVSLVFSSLLVLLNVPGSANQNVKRLIYHYIRVCDVQSNLTT